MITIIAAATLSGIILGGLAYHFVAGINSNQGRPELRSRPSDRTHEHLNGRLLYGGRFRGNGFKGIVAIPSEADYAVALDHGEYSYGQADTPFLHWPIDDSGLPDTETLHTIADFVINCIERGQTVFVYCHAGENRSALLVGLVLHKATNHSGGELIETIQHENPDALRNRNFRQYLRDHD